MNNSDTLNDNITIPCAEEKVILDCFPASKLGQQLSDFLSFKTIDYLRASHYESWSVKEGYSDKDMYTMYTKGLIHFTCKVRKKLQPGKLESKGDMDISIDN